MMRHREASYSSLLLFPCWELSDLLYICLLSDIINKLGKDAFMVEQTQPGLFALEEDSSLFEQSHGEKDSVIELSALDEMLRSSGRYCQSCEYLQMMEFVGRFRQYSPFNCLLVYIQDPSISYVATARDWEQRFGRRPQRKARPLVILQPFGPVMFLYDLKETEGDPVPDDLAHPFKTEGFVPGHVLSNTIHNCSSHRIEVRHELEDVRQAGMAIRLDMNMRRQYEHLAVSPDSRYLILLNRHHTNEEQYSTLAHELAHIFCGHLGDESDGWWQDRRGQDDNVIETEAESVAYLVCRRRGLKIASERYLANYRLAADQNMPLVVLNAVLHVTDYIEKMGEAGWKKPKLKTRREE